MINLAPLDSSTQPTISSSITCTRLPQPNHNQEIDIKIIIDNIIWIGISWINNCKTIKSEKDHSSKDQDFWKNGDRDGQYSPSTISWHSPTKPAKKSLMCWIWEHLNHIKAMSPSLKKWYLPALKYDQEIRNFISVLRIHKKNGHG